MGATVDARLHRACSFFELRCRVERLAEPVSPQVAPGALLELGWLSDATALASFPSGASSSVLWPLLIWLRDAESWSLGRCSFDHSGRPVGNWP